jgi:hypothetical protein
MFGDPLSGLFFGGETLDHFRLAIRPKNIDHPAKSGIFSRHENGPEFGHPANMRLRRAGSSQYRCLIRRGDAAGGIPLERLFRPGRVVVAAGSQAHGRRP